MESYAQAMHRLKTEKPSSELTNDGFNNLLELPSRGRSKTPVNTNINRQPV